MNLYINNLKTKTMNKNLNLTNNIYNINIKKNAENFIFFIIFFFNFFQRTLRYKYNKNILNFQKLFEKNSIVLVRWREPGIATALSSGKHAVHVFCRNTSIIPICSIFAIYWQTHLSFIHTHYQIKTRQTHKCIFIKSGSGGSRTLVFNIFLILSTSCVLRE